MDGTCTSSIQGIPITQEWIYDSNNFDCSNAPFQISFTRNTQAKCILVIEKEGIYTRLSEDRFYDPISSSSSSSSSSSHYPCILVTGRGFPDLATRAFVHTLYTHLNIPVIGICDCNPFGVSVLQTYEKGGEKMGYDATLYSVPVIWLGIRPSHIMELQERDYPSSKKKKKIKGMKEDNRNGTESSLLPGTVFQQMTELDYKRVNKLISIEREREENRDFEKIKELELMMANGYKVELEALHWLGMDYLTNWLAIQLKELTLLD